MQDMQAEALPPVLAMLSEKPRAHTVVRFRHKRNCPCTLKRGKRGRFGRCLDIARRTTQLTADACIATRTPTRLCDRAVADMKQQPIQKPASQWKPTCEPTLEIGRVTEPRCEEVVHEIGRITEVPQA